MRPGLLVINSTRNFWLGYLKLLLPLLLGLLALLSSSEAHAYSWMIRYGQSGCASCHTDPSGGETLTVYGRYQSARLLSTQYGNSPKEISELPRSAGFAFGALAPSDTTPFWADESTTQLLLGGSLRFLSITEPESGDFTAFPMQADLYGQLNMGKLRAGGSLGVARVEPGSPHVRAAQVTTNQGDEMNLISRTHYVGYAVSPRLLVRAGRLNLPFGIRVPEHVLWVRESTRTDRESDQQHGVALAYSWRDKLRTEVMGILGNYQLSPDVFRERGYSGYVEWGLVPKWALGASSLLTFAGADLSTYEREATTRGVHGVFSRAALVEELVLLAEFDLTHQSRGELGYAGFAQLDLKALSGLHFALTGEVLLSSAGGEAGAASREPGLGGWLSVNWYFLTHLDMRVDAIVRSNSELQILTQLHAYL